MTSDYILRIVNRDSVDFPTVGHDFKLGFDRRFEENPSVMHWVNNLDLLRNGWKTAVCYDPSGRAVAGLLVDETHENERQVKAWWADPNEKGAGRRALTLAKIAYASIDKTPQKWVAFTRILRDGRINPGPAGALKSLQFSPYRVHALEVIGTHSDVHLVSDLDPDGRYRALEWVAPGVVSQAGLGGR